MRLLSIIAAAVLLGACGSAGTEQASAGGAMQHSSTPITGDQDVDFANMMIAHHQGAIDMARQQLVRGRDPELKALAANMIEEQQQEITQMQAWLGKRQAS
jgi:uncharacterized protein (DUF305 family)